MILLKTVKITNKTCLVLFLQRGEKELFKQLLLFDINQYNYCLRLVAVVTFSHDHFVTHSRRASGVWQLYNDMAKEITTSKMNEEIEPHLTLYIKQH